MRHRTPTDFTETRHVPAQARPTRRAAARRRSATAGYSDEIGAASKRAGHFVAYSPHD